MSGKKLANEANVPAYRVRRKRLVDERLAEARQRVIRCFGQVIYGHAVIMYRVSAPSAAPRLHPLEELSDCPHPEKVTSPEGRDAVTRVLERLRLLLRTTDRWPKPFQIVALAYCEIAGDRCLIADEQGLGKTPEAICRILLGGHFPAVVVCTASTFSTWQDELAAWAPRVPIWRLDKRRRTLPPAGWRGVVLVTWDLLRDHALGISALRPRILVADEAHNACNLGTDEEPVQRTRALAWLLERVPHALLLTGTPIKNTAEELWTLLHMLDPRAWPSPDAFSDVSQEDIDHGQLTRLRRRLRQYMIRRLKEHVLTDLTAKAYSDVPVLLLPAAMAEYKQVERRFEDWLYRALAVRVAREAQRLGRPIDTPELVQEVYKRAERTLRAEYLAKVGYLRRMVGILKAPHAVDWIARTVANGEGVVAFAEHKEVIDAVAAGLRARGVRFVCLVGKTSKDARRNAVASFKAGDVDVFLASQAAREGLTLTRARHVLRIERWWNPALEDQGDDRVHRISQTRDVHVWVMRAANTIDERMGDINRGKRAIVERVVGGTAHAPAQIDPGSRTGHVE